MNDVEEDSLEKKEKLLIKPIKKIEAIIISQWIYEEPYSFYNMGDEKGIMDEMLNEPYYLLKNGEKEIIGFFCFGKAAQIPEGKKYGAYVEKDRIDIGLGMRPDLTGKGRGVDFLLKGLEFAAENFFTTKFHLTVATFNQRAIKVYKKVGFKEKKIFKIPKNENPRNDIEFMTMELNFNKLLPPESSL